MNQGERINNTRRDAKPRPRPAKRTNRGPKKDLVCFDAYIPLSDQNGFFARHMAPCSYFCEQVRIYIDSTDGGQVELGVDDTEFVRSEVKAGENTIQIKRIIPEGSRIKMKFIDTDASGIWVAWKGVASG